MRRYLFILSLGWMLPLVVFVGVNWLVDPYRIFHKPWIGNNYYTSDRTMRDAAAGIINTEEFKSIILGSSMAANFSANEASQIWGDRFVNISMDGSGIPERSLVLNYALRKKNLSEVIFSIDGFAQVSESPIAPYAFLYDSNRGNDLLIYATNLKPIRYALCRNLIFTSDALCPNRKNDLESLVEWHSDWEHSKRFGGLNKWLEAKNNGQIKDALKSISDSVRKIESGKVKTVDSRLVERNVARNRKLFNESLLSSAAQYPETRFYLFFPPYSCLNYGILKQSDPQRFEEYIGLLRSVIRDTEKHPNVKIFGFETKDFLDDVANYKDTSHYHQRINSEMLHWMKKGSHELTPSNIEPYIQEITARAANYPLKQIGTQIDTYLIGRY